MVSVARSAAQRGAIAHEFARRKTADAEERHMKKNELQTILGYLNIGLAIAHNAGVSIGHFGSTDFIQLAQAVNGVLLQSIEPAATTAN
jgi:hypothetical protein